MEYPFKDLMPLDEVLEREGYYKDWTHLDPKTFYSLVQISEMIKTKGYGADVRLLISQLAEHFGLSVVEVTDTANKLIARQDKVEQFNTQTIQEMTDKDVISAPELIEARKGENKLSTRLDKEYNELTAQLAQTESDLNSKKADKVELDLVESKISELGAVATFKGSDTNVNILAKTGVIVGDEWWDTTNATNLRWNGSEWINVGGLLRVAEKSITGDKLNGDLQSKLGIFSNEGTATQNGTQTLPSGTTRFNNIPSNSSGNVDKIFLNVKKVGTAKLKVIEKMTEVTFKTVFDQTVTLNKIGNVTLQSTVDFQNFEIKQGQYIAWRGITAELGYSAGGSAFYVTPEGAIGAQQTYTPHEITLDIGWRVRGEGSLIKDVDYLKAKVEEPVVVGDGSIEPKKTTFFEVGKNLIDPVKIKKGFFINQVTGAYVASEDHDATDYMPVKPNTTYTPNQYCSRYAFFKADGSFISGGVNISSSAPVTTTPDTELVVLSSESWEINSLQFEEGTASTAFEKYGYKMSNEYLPPIYDEVPEPQFVSDSGKQYRIVGANIRTPSIAGGNFSLHDDANHEPMGVSWVAISGDELRVGMPFSASKVVTMSVVPHVSMRNAGYEVATTGGLNVHAVWFYKDGVKVPASEVVINEGSFWFSGTFLV